MSNTNYATAADCVCQQCMDDPCQCRDCYDCSKPGFTDEMQRVGDDYLCEDCHVKRFESEIRVLFRMPPKKAAKEMSVARTIERAGIHQQHMDREDALRDYQLKVQDLRLVCRHFEVENQEGYPIYHADELLALVDRANQALQTIAACAPFVGRKEDTACPDCGLELSNPVHRGWGPCGLGR